MNRTSVFVALCLSVLLLPAGCMLGIMDLLGGCQPHSYIRLWLVNDSKTKYVSPHPGLCPQGLTTLPHYFVDQRPVLAPGESKSYTTVEMAGAEGLCVNRPDFMIGLCGWNYGDDPANLTGCSDRYGGQIGYQFNCGDTVILHWTDSGAATGTWTSEVLPANGNPAPSAPFQMLPPPEGGTCQQ